MSQEARYYRPHRYQEICADWLESHERAGLFLDCGMGKTVITLTALYDRIHETYEVSKALVIAPKKVAEDTWPQEIQKWEHLSDLRLVKVLGSVKQRHKAMQTDADLYVINRENISWLVDNYASSWPFDMIVIDEWSSFKSSKSDRFRALKKVCKLSRYFIGLTGTPQPNGLMDLWAQVYLLDQGKRLGKTIGAYKRLYFNERQGYSGGHTYKLYDPKPSAEDEIHAKLKDIIVSLSADDWLSVPEAAYVYHRVELSHAEQSLINELTRERVLQIDGGTVVASNAGQVSLKLLQLANGAIYGDDGEVLHVHDRKLEALDDLIEAANGKPIMVFYWFKHDYDRIYDRYRKRMIISDLKTSNDREAWNQGELDMALVHPASMGHGLNLQDGGNIIIWFSMTDSLELYMQANARLHRQGQRQKVLIHHIIAEGTHDEDAVKNLQNKDCSQQRLIEALKARLQSEIGYEEDIAPYARSVGGS